MNTEHLVKMANQIAGFFASYPDQEAAAIETATHLRKFWAPPMRERLIAHAQEDAGDLAPVTKRAVELLQAA